MNCRFCKHTLSHEFVDLFNSPPSNSFLSKEELSGSETYFPLKLNVCENCFLVQVDEYKKAGDIFNSDYIYFSSYSKSWLTHASAYVDKMMNTFRLNSDSLVVEIASNDGYLLQYFKIKGVQVLGIEPTHNTAAVARKKGIESITEFFGERFASKLSRENRKADLLLGNNVLAHVPDINDFVKGLKIALKPDGIITMEFPHLMQLIENNQFDTIYHEHFSYLSFSTVSLIFEAQELRMFDVEEISTHGGSLRIYAKHAEDNTRHISSRVRDLLEKEEKMGLKNLEYYKGFSNRVNKVKWNLLQFLIDQKCSGNRIVAYGAAAKGNTLLNYCGIKPDLVDFVVDASPHKQGKFLPGSHIPVLQEEEIRRTKPEFILILPWNIQEEIKEQLSYIREWNARFVVAIPELLIL